MNTKATKRDAEKIRDIIGLNYDARRYFFTKADESWLEWLWHEGFLEVLKQGIDTEKQYFYPPELEYLTRMSSINPGLVSEIILSMPVNHKTFNPQVVDGFLHICGTLKSEYTSKLVRKIREEDWLRVMGRYNRWGFDYEKILKTLLEVKDYKGILLIGEMLLSIRSKEEIAETNNGVSIDRPFYLDDIIQTKVFRYLAEIDDDNLEEALNIGLKSFNDLASLQDGFYSLYDVDFFTLALDSHKHISYRDDIRELAAMLKMLTHRFFIKFCQDGEKVRSKYFECIDRLPFNQVIWRYQLFTASICPDVFKDVIEVMLFKIFIDDESGKLTVGAEYKQLLKRTFGHLPIEIRSKYIEEVFRYYGERVREDEYYISAGLRLLSCVYSELSEEDLDKSEKIFGQKPRDGYEPEPSISTVKSGFVSPQAPLTIDELSAMSIIDAVTNLRGKWSPKSLKEQNVGDDIFSPINADGMGSLLRQDMSSRLAVYIENASLFFDRDNLGCHYTYIYLQGVYDLLSKGERLSGLNLENLLSLISSIAESGNANDFGDEKRGRNTYGSWLAGWNAVHGAACEVLNALLGEGKKEALIDFPVNRDAIFDILKYYFSYNDPEEDANFRDKGSDPYTTAINSVRGRAFKSMLLFVQNDGYRFVDDDVAKISDDVKKLYELVLANEKTFAIRFMYGHHLITFYSRDKEWIRGLFNNIFPQSEATLDLFLATWEGNISQNLYKELFDDLADIYAKAIRLNPDQYTQRRYFRELDDGLGTHMALAYVFFKDFDLNSALYKSFWSINNQKRHSEFVSFIGQSVIDRADMRQLISDKKIEIEKLTRFWDWALENVKDPEVLACFGSWVNAQKNIFDNKWLAERAALTLEKSGGSVSWEYALMKSLPVLVKDSPKHVLKVLDLYSYKDFSIYIDNEVFDVLNELHANPDTRSGAEALINRLLLRGGQFWKLKEIISGQ